MNGIQPVICLMRALVTGSRLPWPGNQNRPIVARSFRFRRSVVCTIGSRDVRRELTFAELNSGWVMLCALVGFRSVSVELDMI